MPVIIASPIMNRIPLAASRVGAAETEAARANIMAKKNTTATAIAPRIAIAFIISCGVLLPDLNLVLKESPKEKLIAYSEQILQYLFKLGKPNIAIILINIYMVHNQDTEDCVAWFGMMIP
jgi:hypothetical protein